MLEIIVRGHTKSGKTALIQHLCWLLDVAGMNVKVDWGVDGAPMAARPINVLRGKEVLVREQQKTLGEE